MIKLSLTKNFEEALTSVRRQKERDEISDALCVFQKQGIIIGEPRFKYIIVHKTLQRRGLVLCRLKSGVLRILLREEEKDSHYIVLDIQSRRNCYAIWERNQKRFL